MSVKISRLYSIIRFLEKVEEGDSLTDLERKTQLSNVTIQGVVKDLESKAILTTQWKRTSRGKIRECTNISEHAKILATHLIRILDGARYFFEKGAEENLAGYSSPLFFQIAILHKTLEKTSLLVEKEISKEAADFFREWIYSNGELSKPDDFSIATNRSTDQEESAILKKGKCLFFDPDIFTVFVDFSSKRWEKEDTNIWKFSREASSEGEIAAD